MFYGAYIQTITVRFVILPLSIGPTMAFYNNLKMQMDIISKNSHQLMAGPLSRRLRPSISRNNEK